MLPVIRNYKKTNHEDRKELKGNRLLCFAVHKGMCYGMQAGTEQEELQLHL
jgi:hypothetical protein